MYFARTFRMISQIIHMGRIYVFPVMAECVSRKHKIASEPLGTEPLSRIRKAESGSVSGFVLFRHEIF